jgi:hypothetical protein
MRAFSPAVAQGMAHVLDAYGQVCQYIEPILRPHIIKPFHLLKKHIFITMDLI